MKKLMLGTAAVALVAFAASPAQAQVELGLGGHMKLYGFYTDQDNNLVGAGVGEERDFDIIRDTEVHFGGETTLDNGLTVGIHIEAEADTEESFDVQESYAYMSGGWGRVNIGAEDGAAYLLQVAAPAADENLDGIRQYVNPVNYATALGGTGLGAAGGVAVSTGDGLDYDMDVTGYADKITYLSPVFNGFQVGLSYTPDIADASTEDAANLDDFDDALGEVYEIGARYEGTFNDVGVTLGGGYSHAELEDQTGAQAGGDSFSDDRTDWNVGIDLDIGPFGLGVAYYETDYGDDPLTATSELEEEENIVVGVDYTTGPFRLGASYLNSDGKQNIVGDNGTDGVEADRYTGGVVYTYGPGMTFRGSISYVEFENVAGLTGTDTDTDATSFLLGTQINF